MKLVPYRKTNDLKPMSNMLSMFDEFFNRYFNDDETPGDNYRVMALDIVEHDKEFEIMANLPGFRKENVKISVHDNQLMIEATVDEKKQEQKGTVYRCERYSGNYRRNLLLPENAEPSKISARMEDGVLKVLIPKKEPSPKKDIEIQ
ncbi:MAG: Hsp20 family protein [Candidatus Cloacimonetes bacterium]|nr:Hsp20 family protein [Candidatus Cloacimonadota bacterium]